MKNKKHFIKKKNEFSETAARRIKYLFEQAEKADDPKYSSRYVQMALRISSRFKSPVPKELSARYCRKCNSYLIPSRTSQVRIGKSRVSVKCLKCNNVRRYVIKKAVKK